MQTFEIEMRMPTTGEIWSQYRDADDPVRALQAYLRQKRVAERLLSEQPVRFVVRDVRP